MDLNYYGQYNLSYSNCSTLGDKCETGNDCTEYGWGNWYKEMRVEGVDWSRVSQHGDRCLAVVSTLMNCRV